jgi:Protein of unknown function (DUF3572)
LRPSLTGSPELQQESAHVIALQALAWIVSDDDRLAGLMAESGIDPGTLRSRADAPDVLGAVLDHLLRDDQAVIAFCDSLALPYTAPMTARAALPGGDTLHWT